MKRGTAAKVILGKDTLMDVPAGIVHGTDVILGGKAGLLNDFGGLVLSNNLMIGKKVSRGTITTVTVRGVAPIILPDAIAGSLQAVKAFGGTEQSGTPNPDAPVDIVSNNGVLKYSKNLLDMSAENIVLGKYINNSGDILDSGPDFYNSKYIPVVGRGVYTWSTSSSISCFSVMEYDSGYVFKKRTIFSNAGTRGSITLRSDTAFVLIGSNMDSTDITLDKIAAVDWQFEKGSSATAYRPYSPTGFYTDGTVETINAHGKNLFDISTIEDGYFFNASGEVVANDKYAVSAPIPIKLGTYTFSQIRNYSGTSDAMSVWGFAADGTVVRRLASATGTACALQTFEVQQDIVYIRVAYRQRTSTEVQVELGSTATAYAPYYNGGTATAEMLLKVGDYQDVQSIIDGVVTRKVGIKVLDGTESGWTRGTSSIYNSGLFDDAIGYSADNPAITCSHFRGLPPTTSLSDMPDLSAKLGSSNYSKRMYFQYDAMTTAAQFKQFLADQYAAGTPVIIVYPLATPTTESVAGQALQVTDGDNVLEITQASLSGLELEATYKPLVQLTIQEVEDANLNNNVEVTIS